MRMTPYSLRRPRTQPDRIYDERGRSRRPLTPSPQAAATRQHARGLGLRSHGGYAAVSDGSVLKQVARLPRICFATLLFLNGLPSAALNAVAKWGVSEPSRPSRTGAGGCGSPRPIKYGDKGLPNSMGRRRADRYPPFAALALGACSTAQAAYDSFDSRFSIGHSRLRRHFPGAFRGSSRHHRLWWGRLPSAAQAGQQNATRTSVRVACFTLGGVRPVMLELDRRLYPDRAVGRP